MLVWGFDLVLVCFPPPLLPFSPSLRGTFSANFNGVENVDFSACYEYLKKDTITYSCCLRLADRCRVFVMDFALLVNSAAPSDRTSCCTMKHVCYDVRLTLGEAGRNDLHVVLHKSAEVGNSGLHCLTY